MCEFRKVDLIANNAGSRLAWIVNDHRKHVNLTFPTLKTAALHLQFHSDSHFQALSVEGFTRSMFCYLFHPSAIRLCYVFHFRSFHELSSFVHECERGKAGSTVFGTETSTMYSHAQNKKDKKVKKYI